MSENILEKRPHLIPSAIAALMLFGALAYLPYGYYQLLRFVVCVVSMYIVVMAFQWHKLWVMWLFGFVAVLFNPLIPIHLPRGLWHLIDVICGLMFIAITSSLSRPIEGKAE